MLHVLIVCAGNTCRSPMAEYILKELIASAGLSDRIKVESAGIHAKDGAILSAHVATLLTKYGIVHDSKRIAKHIRTLDPTKFDYIFVMTQDLMKQLQAELNASDIRQGVRLFLDNEDVLDPYGADLATYEKIYHILYKRCLEIVKSLHKSED